MKVPVDRRYAETHEWFLIEEGVATMGITQFAADELTDITFVELPEVGKTVAMGDSIGEVESVKATSEVFTAVSGTITEVNVALVDHPELLNDDAFEEGWIVRIAVDNPEQVRALMTAKEYASFVKHAI
jgi:glycine cleavage system H protein